VIPLFAKLDLPVVMEKKTTFTDISARKHCNRSRFLSVRKETGMILCFILYWGSSDTLASWGHINPFYDFSTCSIVWQRWINGSKQQRRSRK
jgi:hypothetical protein